MYFGSNTGDDEYKHGLAIAWEDENGGATMTFEAAKEAIAAKTAVPGGKWKLLESKPWREIFVACGQLDGCGGSGNMNKWIGEVGGQQFVKGDYYWAATPENSGNPAAAQRAAPNRDATAGDEGQTLTLSSGWSAL